MWPAGRRLPAPVLNRSLWCFSLWCFSLWCFSLWCFSLWCFSLWCFSLWCFSLWCFSLWCFSLWCFSLCTDSIGLLYSRMVELNSGSFLLLSVESVQQRREDCPLTSALSPAGNDFIVSAIHQVRKQDITVTTLTQIDKRHCYAYALMCSTTIKPGQPPIRIGSQNLGNARDHGQAFRGCWTDSTGTGRMILNSIQLICFCINQSSLYTGQWCLRSPTIV